MPDDTRLVSYSLYRSTRHDLSYYFEGMLWNVADCCRWYPDFVCRCYVADDLMDLGRQLVDAGAQVYYRPALSIHHGEHSGMAWRWEPLLDRRTTVCLIRDADRRIRAREHALVRAFLHSKKTFHVMKLTRCHSRRKVPGGLCASKGASPEIIRVLTGMMMQQKCNYMWDEYYLGANLWPVVRDNSLIHTQLLVDRCD